MTDTIVSLARTHGPVESFQDSDLATFDIIGDVFATRDNSLYRASRVQTYDAGHPGDVWVCLIHQTTDGDSAVETDDVWVTLKTLRNGAAEYGPIATVIASALYR